MVLRSEAAQGKTAKKAAAHKAAKEKADAKSVAAEMAIAEKVGKEKAVTDSAAAKKAPSAVYRVAFEQPREPPFAVSVRYLLWETRGREVLCSVKI